MYDLRRPPGGGQTDEAATPRSRSVVASFFRWRSEVLRGFHLGFGWLLGTVFAVLCCVMATLVASHVIRSATVWWTQQQATWQQGGATPAPKTSAWVAREGTDADASAGPRATEGSPALETADASSSAPGDKPRGLRGFAVTSARFYYAMRGRAVEPIMEICVRNNTPRTIARVNFCATLTSPDRKLPWAEDYFGYNVAGGLEPGAEDQWQLLPDRDDGWGDAPRDGAGLVLNVVPVSIEDAAGKLIE